MQFPDLNALIMRRFKGPNDVEEARQAVHKVCNVLPSFKTLKGLPFLSFEKPYFHPKQVCMASLKFWYCWISVILFWTNHTPKVFLILPPHQQSTRRFPKPFILIVNVVLLSEWWYYTVIYTSKSVREGGYQTNKQVISITTKGCPCFNDPQSPPKKEINVPQHRCNVHLTVVVFGLVTDCSMCIVNFNFGNFHRIFCKHFWKQNTSRSHVWSR